MIDSYTVIQELIPVAFKYGMIFAGAFGFIGYLIGLLFSLFNDYKRG